MSRSSSTLTLWQTKMEKHGVWLQDHQCKFRASQKDAFVATAHAHMKTQKRQGHVVGFSWNEVNFYSDGGIADGGFAAAMLRNLVGVMVIRETAKTGTSRTTGRSAPSYGSWRG